MPKRTAYLPQALCWQKRLKLQPPQMQETIEHFIKRIVIESTNNHTLEQLCQILKEDINKNVTRQALSWFFKSIGSRNLIKVVTEEMKEKAIEMHRSGEYISLKEMSTELGLNPKTVRYHLKEEIKNNLLTTQCKRCKKTLKQTRYDHRFCNVRCYQRYTFNVKQEKNKEYPCAECGEVFLKTGGHRKYCDNCTGDANNSRRWREKNL